MCYQLRRVVVLGLLLGLAACGRAGERQDAAGDAGNGAGPARSPRVVASIYPLTAIANHLLEGFAEVQTLVPAGITSHGFEPNAAQMQMVAKADVLLVVGMNLDPWAEQAAARFGKKDLLVLRLSDVVDTAAATPASSPATAATDDHDDESAAQNDEHESGDPDDHGDHGHGHAHAHGRAGRNNHLWLDPMLVERFVLMATPKFEALLPDQVVPLRNRKRLFIANLHLLHQEYGGRLASLPQQRLITFHNAFDPLAERLGLRVVGHLKDVELAPGAEVTPAQLQDAIAAVRRYNLKVIYAEPQFPAAAAEAVARGTGAAVLILDPMGHPGIEGRRTYLDLLKYNLQTLVEGQSLR